MPGINRDLHGMATDKSPVALLLLDLINDLDFPEADQLLPFAIPMAHRLAGLRVRARETGIPVVYVNDNYGKWRSDFKAHVDHCISDETKGAEIARLLKPNDDDYFVLKPKHSGFFSTTLEVLLDHLEARTLIITGMAGNICVLFTANDAYMRDYKVVVPCDCVASNPVEENNYALRQIESVLKGDIRSSDQVDLARLTEG